MSRISSKESVSRREQRHVLDASALLAVLYGEFGRDVVEQALYFGTAMSMINWAEVLTKVAEKGDDPARLPAQLRSSGLLDSNIVFEPVEPQDCIEIAQLRLQTKSHGLGLGDRACLALARRLELPALTADKSWAVLDLGIVIKLIR